MFGVCARAASAARDRDRVHLRHHRLSAQLQPVLSDNEVRDRLRRAVAMDVIHGWYTHIPLKGKKWVINPMNGPCVSYTDAEVRQFCEMLDAAAG